MSTLRKKKIESITDEDFDIKNMKVRINCWIDDEIILELRKKAKLQKTKYQTLLNATLKKAVLGEPSELEARVKNLESLILKKV